MLKQHSYNKVLNKGAYYIKVPEGHKSKSATGEPGGRLQRRQRRVEPQLRKSLAERRLEEVVDDVDKSLNAGLTSCAAITSPSSPNLPHASSARGTQAPSTTRASLDLDSGVAS
jgi:hypothetical protein